MNMRTRLGYLAVAAARLPVVLEAAHAEKKKNNKKKTDRERHPDTTKE